MGGEHHSSLGGSRRAPVAACGAHRSYCPATRVFWGGATYKIDATTTNWKNNPTALKFIYIETPGEPTSSRAIRSGNSMSRSPRAASIVVISISAIVGAVAGVIASLVISRRIHDGEAIYQRDVGARERHVERIGGLAATLGQLQKLGEVPPGNEALGAKERAASSSLPSTEEEGALARAAHKKAIERHSIDPVDPVLAPRARVRLDETLKNWGPSDRFRVLDVDCRTSSCLAKLEWKSGDEARMSFSELLTTNYRDVSYATQIAVPDEGDGVVEGTLILSNCRKMGP